MHKKLIVLVAVAAVVGTSFIPVMNTKADADVIAVKIKDPIAEAVVGIPKGSYSILPMRITAYSSSADETDYNPLYTADGTHVYDGEVASNLLPFGTKIQIPTLFGNRIFTVHDHMAKRFQRTIDIWMPSKGKALYFGLNYAKIVVLGTSTYNQSPFETKDISANLR